MGALGGPKEAIGEKVAAALVGTFLGILLCYGIFGPLARRWARTVEAEASYFGFLRMGVDRLRQGAEPDHGDGTGAAVDSRRSAADVSGDGRRLPRRRRGSIEGGISMAPQPDAAPAPARPEDHHHQAKKAGHGGHHGGAWKVAYADFVTAMMALFIVLWLMSADEKVQGGGQRVLQQSDGTGQADRHGGGGAGQRDPSAQGGHGQAGARRSRRRSRQVPNFRDLKDHVEITVTSDGLRIELLETEAGMFFESGQAGADRERGRTAGEAGDGTGQDAESNADRRTHRCQAVHSGRAPIPTGSCPRTARTRPAG